MRGITLELKNVFAPANDEAIVQKFTDTDFYKFPMGYFIWKNPLYRDVEVTFKLIIRDPKIKLPEIIPEGALREHLNACLCLRPNPAENSFVGGMTLSDNKTHIMPGDFLAELGNMQLPPYKLEVVDGQYELTFTGPWWKVTWWEIFSMEIVSELYYYYYIKKHGLSEFEVMALYSAMINKAHKKIMLLKEYPELIYVLFDTRRRHARLLQELFMWIMREEMPGQCVGSSNVWLSMKHGSNNPIGTNAHELPMVKACLAGNDVEKIRQSQYDIIDEWMDTFGYDMSIMLIDTFGTPQFLRRAPAWMAKQNKGIRPDSMHPTVNTDLMVEWWKKHDVDPMEKLVLPSDGLDAPEMIEYHRENAHKVGVFSFGWGTLAGNDCRDVWPRIKGAELFRPFSMACKVVSANGVPAVKLSDNPNKATGPRDRIEFFKKIFGVEGQQEQKVIV